MTNEKDTSDNMPPNVVPSETTSGKKPAPTSALASLAAKGKEAKDSEKVNEDSKPNKPEKTNDDLINRYVKSETTDKDTKQADEKEKAEVKEKVTSEEKVEVKEKSDTKDKVDEEKKTEVKENAEAKEKIDVKDKYLTKEPKKEPKKESKKGSDEKDTSEKVEVKSAAKLEPKTDDKPAIKTETESRFESRFEKPKFMPDFDAKPDKTEAKVSKTASMPPKIDVVKNAALADVVNKETIDGDEPKKSKKKGIIIGSIAGVLVLAAAAAAFAFVIWPKYFAFEPEDVTPSPAYVTPDVHTGIWPLTGLEKSVEDKDVERPAISVKIENSPEARPQTGLESADYVIEELVEGGITRFIATFNSKTPDPIGPVRSIRPMDAPLMAPLHGGIVFSGGKKKFITRAEEAGIQNMSENAMLGTEAYFRTPDRIAPHDDYFHLPVGFNFADADRKVPPPEQFKFNKKADDKSTVAKYGTPLAAITANMSGYFISRWEWNPTLKDGAGAFIRFQDGAEFLSTVGGQIQATNLIFLSVEITQTSKTDKAGNTVPETLVSGQEGSGYVASEGKYIPIVWSKSKDAAPIRYYYVSEDGEKEELWFLPGNTWIHLVPNTNTTDITPAEPVVAATEATTPESTTSSAPVDAE